MRILTIKSYWFLVFRRFKVPTGVKEYWVWGFEGFRGLWRVDLGFLGSYSGRFGS